MNVHKLQKKVGFLILIIGLIASINNFVNYVILSDRSLWVSLSLIQVWFNPLVVSIFSIFSFMFNKQWSRLTQSLLLIFTSGIIILSDGANSFFGIWMIIVGVILLYKYGFLYKNFLLLLPVTLWGFLCLSISISNITLSGKFFVALNYSSFIVISLIMLYIVFEEDIRQMVQENRENKKEINKLKPASKVGEKITNVVHSFKNNLNSLNTAIFMISQNKNVEKNVERLKLFSETFQERINNILYLTEESEGRDVVNLSKVLEALNIIYLKDELFVHNARITMNIEPNVFSYVNKQDFIIMLENIYKNAVDAIIDKHIFGNIITTLTKEKLTIENDGGAIPFCIGCEEKCLSTCPIFNKPGYTTKENGTGNGVYHIFKVIKSFGWDVKIFANPEKMIYNISLTGEL